MKSPQTNSILVLLVSFSLATSALAQDKKPAAPAAPAAAAPAAPPMPTPSKELAAFMTPFEGTWKCDTTWPAGAMGPGSPEMKAKSTVKIKKEYGGFSWQGQYTVPKSKAMPGMVGYFQISYEPGLKVAVNAWHDSMGGAGLSTGTISGQSVTFLGDGYGMGSKMKVREVMEIRGPKEAYHKYEMDMGKGFQTFGEDVCKK